MLTLCGFPASNYYNKVKLALLEKSIAFDEEVVYPSRDEVLLGFSPMGKVPYVRTSAGALSESQAIVEYLEEVYPGTPLYPRDPMARAKCRELIHLIELYLELPARRLYPQAFFGGTVSEETRKQAGSALARGAKAIARLTHFEQFAAGAQFTYVDCAAVVHLPMVSEASKTVLGEDHLAEAGPVRDYLARLGHRPHVTRVKADRKMGLEAFLAHLARAASAAPDARMSRPA
jgi:glutathione S-transferase